ncbi:MULTISPECIES: RecQ family ATP-dependent DNA helicase [Bacillus]|uniref:RecQ family ATP-dependent DNA helicase n=1 Tax=Bacillus TaxID=1386 RepID=UPI0002E38A29|nr:MULTISPECIES: RecQ family ATP-dependent DNA helicase [Bacillus]
MNLEEHLSKYFGYESFRDGQEETIRSILNGQHTLAMLATGTGKSICYQLPVYIMKKPAIIISPLVSLMQDQVEQLKLNGEKRVIAINSFLSHEEKMKAFRNINSYNFIFLSPEMLAFSNMIEVLKKIDIGLFVVDEAHCISQWGFDFRPDYLRIGEMREQLNNPLTLALTATATKEVRQDIQQFLHLEQVHEVVTTVNRSNIGIFTETYATYEEKEKRMVELVTKLKKPGIIYFSSKKTAELASEVLQANGIKGVGTYHAGIDQDQRVLIQQQFLQNQLQVICATSAFGMGINKENVRFVIHFHMPTSLEAYLQEIGRAGRDGKQSAAVLLYCQGDEGLPLFLLENETPSEQQLSHLFEELVAHYGEQLVDISRKELQTVILRMGFTDNQERLLNYALEQRNGNIKEAIRFLSKHIDDVVEKKRIQWAKFYNWLFRKECYRKGITEYFNEQPTIDQEICCSNCDCNLEIYFTNGEEYNPFPYEEELDWQKVLSDFLLTKDAEYDEK